LPCRVVVGLGEISHERLRRDDTRHNTL
jgi:hypothetical protein